MNCGLRATQPAEAGTGPSAWAIPDKGCRMAIPAHGRLVQPINHGVTPKSGLLQGIQDLMPATGLLTDQLACPYPSLLLAYSVPY